MRKSINRLILFLKIIFTVFTVYILYSSWSFSEFADSLATIFFILFFLGTISLFFIRKKALICFPKFKWPWQVITILYVFILVLAVILTIQSFYRKYDDKKTAQAIAKIERRKITLDDVLGNNLPPKPDPKINDSTLAGIDANDNGIRDDVELAIFESYPNSPKIRAAIMQYAQALQLQLTEVFNSKTLVATIHKENFAYRCLGKVGPGKLGDNQKEAESLVISNDARNKKFSEVFGYMTTYSLVQGIDCDVDFSLLPD